MTHSFDCGDSVEVPDDALLWRVEEDRDRYIVYSDDLGRHVPRVDARWEADRQKKAVEFDPELSVYWSDHLVHDSYSIGELCSRIRKRRSVAFSISAEQLRSENVRVQHEPDGLLGYPPGCAHVSGYLGPELTDEDRRAAAWDVASMMHHVAESGPITVSRPPR